MIYRRSHIQFRLIAIHLGLLVTTAAQADHFWLWDYWPFNLFMEQSYEESNLESSDQRNTNYQSVNFQKSKMFRANFQNAQLKNSNFYQSDMRETNFLNATLSISNMQHANLNRANFKDAKLDIANMSHTKMALVNFQDSNLQDANLSESDIRKSDFKGANLVRTNLHSSDIYQASFQGARVMLTNFQGSAMELDSFQDTDIQGADFRGANLKETNFRSSYLHPLNPDDKHFTPFGCVAGHLRAKAQRDDTYKQAKKTDERWNKFNHSMMKSHESVEAETCTNLEEASFKEAILYKVDFSNPEHFKYSNLSTNQLCSAQSLYGSTFPQVIMNEIKKNKECSKKLKDKALYEQARDDFLKARKNNSWRTRL